MKYWYERALQWLAEFIYPEHGEPAKNGIGYGFVGIWGEHSMRQLLRNVVAGEACTDYEKLVAVIEEKYPLALRYVKEHPEYCQPIIDEFLNDPVTMTSSLYKSCQDKENDAKMTARYHESVAGHTTEELVQMGQLKIEGNKIMAIGPDYSHIPRTCTVAEFENDPEVQIDMIRYGLRIARTMGLDDK